MSVSVRVNKVPNRSARAFSHDIVGVSVRSTRITPNRLAAAVTQESRSALITQELRSAVITQQNRSVVIR